MDVANLGFRVFGNHHTEKLNLQNYEWPIHIAYLEVISQLDDCPLGFMLTGNVCNCQTSIFKMIGHEDLCDSSTGLI